VFAPNAERVSVIGDFNGWEKGKNPLRSRASSGIWEAFVPGVGAGALYPILLECCHWSRAR
jgi:1,4-alpha-glucan branching enzyme